MHFSISTHHQPKLQPLEMLMNTADAENEIQSLFT